MGKAEKRPLGGHAGMEGDINGTPARISFQESLPPTTRDLLERDGRVFLHQSLSTPCLDVLSGAEGPYLITDDGRRLLDFHGNYVHLLGHGHPEVKKRLVAMMEQLPFCPRRYTHEAAILLAERLAAYSPEGLDRSLFCPSGSIAISTALKIARLVTGRHKVISL